MVVTKAPHCGDLGEIQLHHQSHLRRRWAQHHTLICRLAAAARAAQQRTGRQTQHELLLRKTENHPYRRVHYWSSCSHLVPSHHFGTDRRLQVKVVFCSSEKDSSRLAPWLRRWSKGMGCSTSEETEESDMDLGPQLPTIIVANAGTEDLNGRCCHHADVG